MKDYYQRLGVKPTANFDEIKKAYRQLSKKYHPDMHGGTHTYAEDVFKEIQEAYHTLADDSRRAAYDYQLEVYRNPPKRTVYKNTQGQHTYQAPHNYYRNSSVEVSKADILKSTTVWVALGVGVVWMVFMFMYYLKNEGTGGDDYITTGSSLSGEQSKLFKLREKYSQLGPLEDGVTWGYKNGKYELVDTSGKVLSAKYDWVGGFNEEVAVVKKAGKYGYVKNTGQELTPFKYDFAEKVTDRIAIVQYNNKYYILHFEGRFKSIELTGVSAVGTYAEGLLPVKLAATEKWGYINAEGKGMILPAYWDVTEFRDDLAGVKDTSTHLWGYINPSGKLVIPFSYEKVTVFKDGKARVTRNHKTYIIDNINRCVADCD
ncbi:WG repeat-containing protein [uncultured Microscilla sp.]|uniref:WG repeat-containing protein n=1 Tax=uncultured Microscilla sp. TaxID=432653 RepID=UPI002606FE7A|nr:WG repeat-containing protein [uncultured Microscilla sp.]